MKYNLIKPCQCSKCLYNLETDKERKKLCFQDFWSPYDCTGKMPDPKYRTDNNVNCESGLSDEENIKILLAYL